MQIMAKKKRETDFQKTKLRVGRNLLRANNAMKTDFKSKKIILKEFDSRSKDPIKTLATSMGISSQAKMVCLNSIDNWMNSTNVNLKSAEVVNTVSKYLNDFDPRVRNDCIKCLKHCISLLHNKDSNKSVSPLMPIVLTYVNCGLTHIDRTIANDSLKLFAFLVDFCDNSLFNQLMQTINTRITNKSDIDCIELEICYKIVSLMKKNDNNLNGFRPKVTPILNWSTDNCYCDLNSFDTKKQSIEINLTFQTTSSLDIKERFFKALENVVRNELKILFIRNSNHLSLSVNEAKKLILSIKISQSIGLSFGGKHEIPAFSISGINAKKNCNRKQNQSMAHLNHELSASIDKFLDKGFASKPEPRVGQNWVRMVTRNQLPGSSVQTHDSDEPTELTRSQREIIIE